MTGNRAFRHLARLIATLQLVAFGVAPLFEAASVAAAPPVASVQTANTPGTGLAHDPATCPACQILKVAAHVPQATRLSLVESTISARAEFAIAHAPAQIPRQGFLSRAPPSLLA